MNIGAAVLAAGVLAAGVGVVSKSPTSEVVSAAPVRYRSAPKDAKHLWAKQTDGGTLLRDPLPTLDDGGCQGWATRCTNGKCAGSCE